MSLRRKLLVGLVSLGVMSLAGVATSPTVLAKSGHAKPVPNGDPTIYDSTVQPNPGNLPSESYEASGVGQFGNQIVFGGTARVLDNVTVQMSSWGCVDGNWSTYSTAPCVTPPGATFPVPITLNIYNVGPASAYGPSTAGSLITSVTQPFNIPYRPSADTNYAVDCLPEATAQSVAVSTFAGTWFDPALNKCFNGFLTPITFTFGHVALPTNVIYGVAYNTSDQGAVPQRPQPCNSTSGGCGYDSLNVAVSQEPTAPNPGTDPYPGTTYINVTNPSYASGNYCDAGAAGINVFRTDEPATWPASDGTTSACWSVNYPTAGAPYYVPAVQFNAVLNSSPTITSSSTATVVAGVPFSFTVTTTGIAAPVVSKAGGRLPKGLKLVPTAANDAPTGAAIISGTVPAKSHNGVFTVVIRARNSKNSAAKQRLMFTVTGGR